MEECVRRNDEEGKEINPVTCTFVKKCKEGEVRNDKGRCTKSRTKTKKSKPNSPLSFEPFVYQKPLAEKKRVTYNRKKPKAIKRKNGNSFIYNIGRPGRVTKSAALYAFNNNGRRTRTKRETRNSLNIERAKRGIEFEPKSRHTMNEKPEVLAELEQELGELNEGNMRPLQVRKRAELKKKKAAALSGLGTPIGAEKPSMFE